MSQGTFFADAAGPRTLPVVGEQSDIRYYGVTARSVLNGPETTGMGFWSVNPYVGCAFGCAYCYARYTHRYLMERSSAGAVLDAALRQDAAAMPPWLAFERRIFVKRNAPERLRRALRHGSARHLALLSGEAIVVGTATDPYQPAERRFRLTRGILEVLAEHPGLDVTIITKSPLVTRDVDVLGRLARRSQVSVHVSLITVDRELARRLEPRAPTPEARLRAIACLSAAGIDVGVNVMPVLPGITDDPAALERLVARVAAAGAAHVGACALRLQHEARRRYLPFVAQEFPHLAARYEATYGRGPHAGARYREGLRRFFRKLRAKYRIAAYAYEAEEEEGSEPAPAPVERQMDLFAADERPAPAAPNGAADGG